ncbi:glycine betaine/L-proline ABC transporter substrate-binding protein ProX [Shimia thalassica]|uniref:glycine betaine/L-proline ABC transporter substrate-binding protein ProX n=1 Tax=Shimia thalassica TaxID=1715693 RepID=UPI000C06D3F6|nr:glycine betaine/L-proline ABC transporter substrate-binding protein ProX [Shimia thalassica]MDO6522891.1 glycine betaine/L-proline ABC transporter substrate-binding protein ProX [Shimia thalassica]MDP2518565.1 glycine betaine/L-proline ABC transporter substrate-binding protein ProX [Shimia thalassica]MDP2579950.1 glycine betaine/L-proline ABC transporter substrate-binding protein ProX [Shimia thalassica]PHO05083.1 proline/glycine betaine ABC transporter substrate-binding protein ProX [Rhodob
MNKLKITTAVAAIAFASSVFAQDMPGKGVTVEPIKGNPANAWFQHMVVQLGLEALGYEVEETREADFPAMHLAVASGDASYTVNHWQPLHNQFFDKSGGDAVMVREHAVITGAGQGFYIDKKTAEAHGITSIKQLSDPAVAGLFDSDGDGKANLSGCNPGWGCEIRIEDHIDNLDLRDTVHHDQGSYFAIMADTITRYNEGASILYYTWTPNWISDVLVPGTDVVQIGVQSAEEAMDVGFAINDVYVVANKEFMEDNPAAAAFLNTVEIPISAVNAAQVKLRDGEDTVEDFRRHAEDWVAANQTQFDAWVAEAAKAAQ